MLHKRLAGLFSFTLIILSSFMATIFICGLATPLMYLHLPWYTFVVDFAMDLWLLLPVALLELVLGVKIVLTGDQPLNNDRALIIMNHRCRLDWMFYWSIVARYGHLGREKVVLKNELKHIPGCGWAMQNAQYIFLKRSWEQDKVYFGEILDFLCRGEAPLQVLIFPEGTNMEHSTLIKSNAFANKSNLPLYKRVLHPRVKGFSFCIQRLRQGKFDAVHDVTVAYSSDECFSELDYLYGRLPEEVHFHVQRCPNESLPMEEEALEDWCRGRWEQKETRLTEFYNGRFRMTDSDAGNNLHCRNEASVVRAMKLALVGWSGFVLLTLFLVFYSRIVWWYFIIQTTYFFVQSTFRGGLDKLHLAALKKYCSKSD